MAPDLPPIDERTKEAIQQVFDRVWVRFVLTQVRQNVATFTPEELGELAAMVTSEQKRRGA